jgi:hypothetical protein
VHVSASIPTQSQVPALINSNPVQVSIQTTATLDQQHAESESLQTSEKRNSQSLPETSQQSSKEHEGEGEGESDIHNTSKYHVHF